MAAERFACVKVHGDGNLCPACVEQAREAERHALARWAAEFAREDERRERSERR